jgi:hypothetical protein
LDATACVVQPLQGCRRREWVNGGPRVAAQPWAMCRNAVGVEGACRESMCVRATGDLCVCPIDTMAEVVDQFASDAASQITTTATRLALREWS